MQLTNEFDGSAGLLGRARAGRKDECARSDFPNPLRIDFVVPHHQRTLPKPLEAAGKVMHKAVVIIDEQNHSFNERNSPSALSHVSWYSRSGSLGATMPPPTGNCHQLRPAVMVRMRMLES